jgi:hypothetical protein
MQVNDDMVRAFVASLDAKVSVVRSELDRSPSKDIATNSMLGTAVIVLDAIARGVESAWKERPIPAPPMAGSE